MNNPVTSSSRPRVRPAAKPVETLDPDQRLSTPVPDGHTNDDCIVVDPAHHYGPSVGTADSEVALTKPDSDASGYAYAVYNPSSSG